MSKNLKDLSVRDILEAMVIKMIDKPEKLIVEEIDGESTIIFQVTVASEDVGKVIGKLGRIVGSIRTVVRAMTAKTKRKVVIEVVDENGPLKHPAGSEHTSGTECEDVNEDAGDQGSEDVSEA